MRTILVSTKPANRKPNLNITFSKVKRKVITRKDFKTEAEYNAVMLKALTNYINYKINKR